MEKRSIAQVYADYAAALKADEVKHTQVESVEETPTDEGVEETVYEAEGFDALTYEVVENDE